MDNDPAAHTGSEENAASESSEEPAAMDERSCDAHQHNHQGRCLTCCYFFFLAGKKTLSKFDYRDRLEHERVLEQLEQRGFETRIRDATPRYLEMFHERPREGIVKVDVTRA